MLQITAKTQMKMLRFYLLICSRLFDSYIGLWYIWTGEMAMVAGDKNPLKKPKHRMPDGHMVYDHKRKLVCICNEQVDD